MRDGGQNPSTPPPSIGGRRVHTPMSPRGYKSDLNKLFETGEVPDRFKDVMSGLNSASGQSAERQKRIRDARNAESLEDFDAAIRALVADHTLPEDEPLLERMLDLEDEDLICMALDQLIEMDASRPIKRRAIIKLRLETIKQVAHSERTRSLAEMLHERL